MESRWCRVRAARFRFRSTVKRTHPPATILSWPFSALQRVFQVRRAFKVPRGLPGRQGPQVQSVALGQRDLRDQLGPRDLRGRKGLPDYRAQRDRAGSWDLRISLVLLARASPDSTPAASRCAVWFRVVQAVAARSWIQMVTASQMQLIHALMPRTSFITAAHIARLRFMTSMVFL